MHIQTENRRKSSFEMNRRRRFFCAIGHSLVLHPDGLIGLI
jgi:hypothetical protein